MGQFLVNCPGCNQPLQCDESWAGQTIQCPACQTAMIVPGAEAPASPAPPSTTARPSQTPPRGTSVKSGNRPGAKKHATGKGGGSAMKMAIYGVVFLLAAGGGYVGFQWLMKYQEKSNAKRKQEEKNSDGGQVAHIAGLYDVLDATDPNNFSMVPAPPGGAESDDMGVGGRYGGGAGGFAQPTETVTQPDLPVVPAVYTLELEQAKIPEGRANGSISGTNFVVEAARLDPGPTSYVLSLRRGEPTSPEQEFLVFLKVKAGESPGGKAWTVTRDERSRDVSSVAKRWKTNPRFAPTRKNYFNGYTLKLELGQPAAGVISGKIYLALPDAEQSVVAGVFRAETSLGTGVSGAIGDN